VKRGSDADVIVVGGGISGLAVAWNLQQRGAQVLLLEAAARAGGTIGSVREHGWLLEAGPNSALETTLLIKPLLEELGIAGERVRANPAARNRYVLHHGKLTALPLSPVAFLATPLFSAGAKLGLLREPFIIRRDQDADESVADFVRRRIGREFLDYAVNPFVAGVYAGDPERLSVRAAFPRLHELEQKHGSLLRGLLLGALQRAADPEKTGNSAAMFGFRGGMQTLTDAIADRLARVELNAEVVKVMRTAGQYTATVRIADLQQEYRARAVVFAAPAYVTAQLVAPFAPDVAAALEQIPYSPVAVAATGYRSDTVAHPLDGFGFLVPERERRLLLGTIFSSTLFENRAPRDFILLTTFVGGMRQPGLARLDECEIARIVQREHAALLDAPPHAEFVRIARWARAIPQYTLGHASRIAQVEQAERNHPGLFFCANYRGGIALGDCIQSADRAAGQIAAFLRKS